MRRHSKIYFFELKHIVEKKMHEEIFKKIMNWTNLIWKFLKIEEKLLFSIYSIEIYKIHHRPV